MTRILAITLVSLMACTAPTQRDDVAGRLSYWNLDIKRFMHMHSTEAELRNWLDQRNISYSPPTRGPAFVALLESIRVPGELCPTDIYLVGAVEGVNVLWYKVEARKQNNCDDSLST